MDVTMEPVDDRAGGEPFAHINNGEGGYLNGAIDSIELALDDLGGAPPPPPLAPGERFEIVTPQQWASQTSEAEFAKVTDPAQRSILCVRRSAYAGCLKRLCALAMVESIHAFPNMGVDARQVLAARLARQLANWAVYGIAPPDLASASRDDCERGLAGQTAPIRKRVSDTRRERDAIAALRAPADGGPLPGSNTFVRDLVQTGRGTDPTAVKREEAVLAAVGVLARRLLATPTSPANAIAQRARSLAIDDGVLVARSLAQDPVAPAIRTAILMRAAEAEALMAAHVTAMDASGPATEGAPNPPSGGDNVVLARATATTQETRTLLASWVSARARTRAEDQGRERTRIHDGDTPAAFWCRLFAQPHPASEVGYQPESWQGYYRAEKSGDTTPRRAGLPVKRPLLLAFLRMHRVEFDAIGDWRPALTAVMPTCPAMAILVQGVAPYHMDAHAMLEEYMSLLRFAKERVATPGLSLDDSATASDPSAAAWISDCEAAAAASDTTQAYANPLVQRAFVSLRQDIPDALWDRLPSWCGRWFMPESFFPRPANQAELEQTYPPNSIERVLLGPLWLRASTGEQPPEPQHFLTAFAMYCKELETGAAAADTNTGPNANPVTGPADVAMESADAAETTEARAAQVIAECEREATEPDRGAQGRAETLMAMAVLRAYAWLVRRCDIEYDRRIETLRQHDSVTVDAGGGFDSVRRPDYYAKLWALGLQYLAEMLEIHEMTLLAINSRWIDARAAAARLVPIAVRLDPACVRNARPETCRLTIERRTQSLARRTAADGRAESFGALTTVVPWASNAVDPDRPDAPTYGELILFDHLIDYTPARHESRSQGRDSEDEAIEAMRQRLAQLNVVSGARVSADPDAFAAYHLPPSSSVSAMDDVSGTGSVDKRPRHDAHQDDSGGLDSGGDGAEAMGMDSGTHTGDAIDALSQPRKHHKKTRAQALGL